jgi:hypothetical protein
VDFPSWKKGKETTAMATREMINFKQLGPSPIEQANLSGIVGVGGLNDKHDVMLIQALFRLVGYSNHWARSNFGMSLTDLPEPAGQFDGKTIQAIWGFQRRMAHRLLNVDGKIHPGNYHNRVIKDISGRLMTITLLNFLAVDGALMSNDPDVISALTRIAPHLVLTRVGP